MEWRPIDTAPKDGTPLLLVEDGEPFGYEIRHVFAGYWKPTKRLRAGGAWQNIYRDIYGHPTHWAPLTELPR